MRLRPLALLTLLVLVASAAAADARPRAAKRIAAFPSCQSLVGYATRHVPPVPAPLPRDGGIVPPQRADAPTGAPAPAPMPAAGGGEVPEDTSQTNVQEAGVDEPDTVKTDGRTIWSVANGRLHAVDARAATPRLVGTLELGESWGTTMLLRKDRALLLGSGPKGARWTEVDISDPARPEILRTEDVDGHIVDARMTGRSVRIVVSSHPQAVAVGAPELRDRPAGWLPSRTIANLRSGHTIDRRVRCRAVRRPSHFSGAGVLTVYTVDLTRGLPAVDADAIFTSGDTVYASASNLYVATQRWEVEGASTSIHRFDISDPDRTRYAGTGAVPGSILNQFSLSEDKGVLRVASTVGGALSESLVTTLAPRDGHLVRRGQVGGLGFGERIYAVRFLGDIGYVVTFRQTDPLYTIDLSDPDRPRVRGELRIPGYSAYLHPVGDDLLLGVGQEATDDGRVQGLQLSLFDVSDLERPARLHKLQLGTRFSHSAAEWDHHAFLWWPAAKLAVLPIDSQGFTGAAGFRIGRAGGITETGRVSHPSAGSWTPPISRTLVVGDRLFTLSDYGLKASALDGFGDAGWVAFPPPPDPPCCKTDPGVPIPMPMPAVTPPR